jgi:hypothetical protein
MDTKPASPSQPHIATTYKASLTTCGGLSAKQASAATHRATLPAELTSRPLLLLPLMFPPAPLLLLLPLLPTLLPATAGSSGSAYRAMN